MFLLLIVVILFKTNVTLENFDENNIDQLYTNLIESLRQDPFLLADLQFSSVSQEFIETQIGNFLYLMSMYNQRSRYKRSISDKSENDNIVGLETYMQISHKVARDIKLFELNSTWYIGSLESSDNQVFDLLVIRKYQDKQFIEVIREPITGGRNIAVFPMELSTIIIVADNNDSLQANSDNLTNIYEFYSDEHLEISQKINVINLADVAIWEHQGTIYMCAAHFMERTQGNNIIFEVEMPLYEWRDRYFDEIQYIKGSGTSKISVFSIDDMSYMALANTRSNDDSGQIYSEILKYNPQTEKYDVFQRLLTDACTHIKYFKSLVNGVEEHFIITAKLLLTENSSQNHDASSIIYKFFDNYFIPFHTVHLKGVKEWESITMANGNVILLGSTISDIQCLYYNGWRFEKCVVKATSKVNKKIAGIHSMHLNNFQNRTVLVIASAENEQNMFEVSISLNHKLKSIHDEMLQWCHKKTQEIDNIDTDLVGDSNRGDMSQMPDGDFQQDINEDEEISLTLNLLESRILDIQDKLQDFFEFDIEHITDYNLNITEVILGDEAVIKRISTKNINGIPVQPIIENTLNINDGFVINSDMNFDFVKIDHGITPVTVNNVSVSDIVKLNDEINIDILEITKNATFERGIIVNKTIDGVVVNEKELLLQDVPQTFENCTVKKLIVNRLRTNNLNGANINETLFNNKKITKHLKNLKVENLTVGSYLNGIDFPTLDKYTLRKNGEQTITGVYYFDNLVVDNLDTPTLSGKAVLEDFVRITEGNYKIHKDVRFVEDLSVNNLTAFEYLNNIPVVEGELDVLLKDSKVRQEISGLKTFENLALLDSIKLRGKIIGKDFTSMNPFVTIDSDLVLDGDIEITGEVRSEGLLKVDNIVSSNGLNSLQKLQRDGLKLTEVEIPVRLSFSQHLNVHDVFAENVNNIDPALWVVNGAKEKQVITGWKKFRRDLEITGNTNVFKINDIDMQELETNVLKKDGDQVITGKHHVKYVAVEKRIISNHTTFGPKPWTDVITASEDQVISGTTIFNTNLTATSVFANNVQINGLVNEQNLLTILNDIVPIGTNLTISGVKKFRNLTINNLEMREDFNLLRELNEEVLHVPELKSIDNIAIKNINFNKELNGIDNTDLNGIRDGNMEIILDGDRQYQTVTVFGNVYVESNRINNVEIDDIVNNTMKINEPLSFEFVEFKNNLIVDKITLNGHIENLDLDNILQNGINLTSVISSEKKFQGGVLVKGKLRIGETLNGVDFPKMCRFISPNFTKNLKIKGDAYFAKGPHVKQLNGNSLKEFKDNAWYVDQPTYFKENIEFTSNVEFNNNVTLKGLLNDVNLDNLSKHYLSKTKHQNTSSTLNFTDSVIFENGFSSPQLFIDGKINNIVIEEFTRTVLLHRAQLFENEVYFENCFPVELHGDYLVNKLNLQDDVMRYDTLNVATGKKRFNNLKADTFKMDKNLNVQNVDVIHWLRHAILTTGTFNIAEKKIFKNATFQNGLSLMGRLNNLSFDEKTILLKHLQQNVTGQKTFMHEIPGEVRFKTLKIKGLVNNVDIGELVQNQATKKGHNTFKSELTFLNNITTKNINFEKLYQNINVTELLINITKLESLNNFKENYLDLLLTSKAVDISLQNQAFYLDDFKPIESIPGANSIFSITENNDTKLVTFYDESGLTLIRLLTWNEENKMFEDMEGAAVTLDKNPNYIQKVNLGNVEYIYVEQESEPETEDNTHTGRLIRFDLHNITRFSQRTFLTRGTIHLGSFDLEMLQYHCLLFNDYQQDINIVCVNANEEYHLHQVIASEKSRVVSTLTIDSIPYIITARKRNVTDQPRISIWKFNSTSFLFETHQTIYEGEPISMSTISTPHGHYFATAYGYVRNTLDFGKIVIRKYDSTTGKFISWQNVNINTPIKIEFSLLPSAEVVLYVLTEEPIAPFSVYLYEGISGFTKKIAGTAVSNAVNMNQFSINNEHFVTLQEYDEITILQTLFKGKRI